MNFKVSAFHHMFAIFNWLSPMQLFAFFTAIVFLMHCLALMITNSCNNDVKLANVPTHNSLQLSCR